MQRKLRQLGRVITRVRWCFAGGNELISAQVAVVELHLSSLHSDNANCDHLVFQKILKSVELQLHQLIQFDI